MNAARKQFTNLVSEMDCCCFVSSDLFIFRHLNTAQWKICMSLEPYYTLAMTTLPMPHPVSLQVPKSFMNWPRQTNSILRGMSIMSWPSSGEFISLAHLHELNNLLVCRTTEMQNDSDPLPAIGAL